ncbi:MAG: YdbH domain-containing protein [Candidatus Omnitrophota bacterium]|nr:YdbH domain-containing protein [Candidatus Omnitrophota bacterium]
MRNHRPILGILVTALIACLFSIALIAIFWKTLVLNFAENELRNVFKGSSVSIGSRDITPGALVFRDVGIKTKGRQFLKIKEFRLNFAAPSLLIGHVAEFSIEETVVYAKLKILKVHGLAKYAKGVLSLGNVSVHILSGVAEGSAVINTGTTPYYSASLRLKGIQLEKVVEAFELKEKIDVTGIVSGSLEISGKGYILTELKGKLDASPEGGTLTIKNKEWLDAIALYAKQDINMIVENFKKYHYNEGNAGLGLKGTSIIIDAHLSGEAGKRDLLVSLHDFN